MVQVTNFLLKWLFLCRLVDDRAEVQTWPYRRPGYYDQYGHQQQPQQQQPQQQIGHHTTNNHPPQRQPPPPPPPPNSMDLDAPDQDMPSYRESCIRSLTSHPPGSQERLHQLDELRLQAVREFAKKLRQADEVLRWERRGNSDGIIGNHDDDDDGEEEFTADSRDLEEDVSIYKEFEEFMQQAHHHRHHHHLDGPESSRSHNDIVNSQKRWNILRGNPDMTPPTTAASSLSSSSSSSSSSSTNISSTSTISSPSSTSPSSGTRQHPTPDQIRNAQKLLSETRIFLPQLVSAVLHSPPSLQLPTHHHQTIHSSSSSSSITTTTTTIDPISSLRSLLIHRCQIDPSLGIELCWLLEAEVGRKWKALFEHRQQTGKRLILIVQADIAQAIATIGAEKASAFNLLQDAEMATAFGREREMEGFGSSGAGMAGEHLHGVDDAFSPMASTASSPSRPPRSISDLRCRHFGDSMHFVDRLTQISLDLRHVPPMHRKSHLQAKLHELNKRLCRRMITRGKVSIDVESLDDVEAYGGNDVGRSHPYFPHSDPHARPHHFDHYAIPSRWTDANVREDMIQHSVHFPMEPQCVRWPGGTAFRSQYDNGGGITNHDHEVDIDGVPLLSDFEHPPERNGVVRALRILPEHCRLLDSRERCPFLVRMEVVETGLEANDARLYAVDVDGVGLTVEEALGSVKKRSGRSGFGACDIPPELMGGGGGFGDRGASIRSERSGLDGSGRGGIPGKTGSLGTMPHSERSSSASFTDMSSGERYASFTNEDDGDKTSHKAVLSRGGYQDEDDGFYSASDMYGDYNTYEMIREQHYEEVHSELQHRRENAYQPSFDNSQMITTSSQQLSTGSYLLDKVFGKPWNAQCENIRLQSPYRNVEGWRLASFIIKAGEDIRKEALVMQIMSKLWSWFQEEIPPHLRPFLRPYTIMCVGGDAGLVECLPDVKSVNEVKKETDGFTTLFNFFERAFGPPIQPPLRPDQPHHYPRGTISFEKARDNFLRSLVGYSVVCYILQIKDRHNANILMDREGHIMHIDFGFVLGETPKMGKVPLFSERAPFKLSAEFWEVIGGWSAFKRFCEMFEAAYAVAAAHSDEICSLVEAAIVNVSRNSDLARSIADGVRGRIRMKADPKEQKMHIMNIVNDAITSWGTSTYDWLQRSMNGYQ